MIFPPPALEKLIAATTKWLDNGLSENEGMVQVFTRGPDKQVMFFFRCILCYDIGSETRLLQPCIVCVVMYNGSESEGREKFKFLYELGESIFQNIHSFCYSGCDFQAP